MLFEMPDYVIADATRFSLRPGLEIGDHVDNGNDRLASLI